jgi:hypothetical protein
VGGVHKIIDDKLILIGEIKSGTMGGAYIESPIPLESVFGGKRIKVKVLFENKLPYRGTMSRMGTRNQVLIILKEIRKELGKEIGDTILAEITLDTEPRVVPIPEDLESALKAVPDAFQAFEALSYSQRREIVQYLNSAIKPETRSNRVSKIVDKLKG